MNTKFFCGLLISLVLPCGTLFGQEASQSPKTDESNQQNLKQMQDVNELVKRLYTTMADITDSFIQKHTELLKRISALEQRGVGASAGVSNAIIDDLYDRVASIERNIEGVSIISIPSNQPNVSALSKKLQDLEERLNSLAGNSSYYGQYNVTDLSQQVVNLKNSYSELEQKVGKLGGSSYSSYSTTSISDLSSSISRLSNQVDDLERKVSNLSGNSYSSTSIYDLSQSISRLESKISDLSRSTSDISSLKSDLRSLQSDLNRLESKVQ